jgi:uncharacterized protein
MSAGDLIRLAVFLICVGTFCVIALGYTVLSLRWWTQGYQPSMQVSCVRTLVLALALLGIICLLYGRFVEPFWLEVKHVSLKSERLHRGTSLRIVHFSDLHSGAWPRLEDRIPALIAAQNPDLIVFTGDAVVRARGLPFAQGLFAALSTIAPVYAVPGNQDYRFKEVFAVNGLHTLERGIAELEVRGNRVSIVGAGYDNDDALPALVRSVSRDSFRILLYHSPDQIEKIAVLGGVDVYCAGHTHGGQVVLPWYGAVITMTKMGKKYESGLYRVAQTYLYVNRGLGMDTPRVRFLARPEITVLDVEPTH